MGARYAAPTMDPTAMALIMGLQQAKSAARGEAPGATAAPATSFADRCPNEPLFRLEGEPVRVGLKDGRMLEFVVVRRTPQLVLARRDEHLLYTFPAEQATRLLSPPQGR